jgi:hypothetical protein
MGEACCLVSRFGRPGNLPQSVLGYIMPRGSSSRLKVIVLELSNIAIFARNQLGSRAAPRSSKSAIARSL